MKRTIIALIFAVSAFAAPFSVTRAQTVEISQNAEYRALIIQIIGLLQQKIAILQAQLKEAEAREQSTGSTRGDSNSDQTQDTIKPMPEITCTLTIGDEGIATTQAADGSKTSIPSGRFTMAWTFPEGAVGVLESDNGDSGTLKSASGTRTIRTTSTAHYTLTVSKEGFEDAVCTATAVHSS